MQKSFLYANGVVASLSNTILPKEIFNRMTEAHSSKEALEVLQETNFASGVTIDSPFQIEELLNFETKKLLNFIKNECPIDELMYFFLLPYDYRNIANYCKSSYLNQNFSSLVEAEGFYEVQKIKELISSKRFEGFNNDYIENALKEFQIITSKPNVRGDEIDYLFKSYLYKNLLQITKKNSIVKKLVELKIDIENISTAMRASSQYHLEQQKLDCASIKENTLYQIFKKNKDAVSDVKDEILKVFVKLAISDNREKSFVEFEKLKNTYAFKVLDVFKDNINSVGPFANYCFKKSIEIKNIRLIMSYQNNNLSDGIRKRFLEC